MLADIIKKLTRGEDLTAEEASQTMAEIMTGEAGDIRTAGILVALGMKGETSAEIEAFARSMRKAAVAWPGQSSEILCDTCGTGGDGSGTLNISTLSAILLASMGIKMAKHGNRAVSSKFGSADLLEGFGISLELENNIVAECLEKVGICFLFAQKWHPAMRFAAPIRKGLGIRTVFNILGPLTNPAPVSHQVLGIFNKDFVEPMARALAGLGRKGAYVVHSEDGMDEVSLSAGTFFNKVEDGKVTESGILQPEDFGFEKRPLTELQVSSKDEVQKRSRAILEGKGSDAENAVISINAALVHSMVNNVPDLKQAGADCLDTLKSGKGWQQVEKWLQFADGSGSVLSMGD